MIPSTEVVKENSTVRNKLKERLLTIDTKNSLDILWLYKNILPLYTIGVIEEVVNILKDVVINDYSVGCIIFEDISRLVLKVYNDEYIDIEIDWLYLCDDNICVNNNINMHKHSKDIISKDLEFTKNTLSINSLSKHFFYILSPIMDTCTKQVVDLLTYIYKKDKDLSNIDLLIKKYEDRSDILIELYLLRLKLSKEKSIVNIKPFDLVEDNSNTSLLLKEMLLDYEDRNLYFFIENTCLYLNYNMDNDLLSRIIKYCQSGYKACVSGCMTINLYKLLCDYLDMNEDILKCGVYDFNYFLKWSRNSLQTLSLVKMGDLLEISRIWIVYYRKERGLVYDILINLIECSVQNVEEGIKRNVMEYINEVYEWEMNRYGKDIFDGRVVDSTIVDKGNSISSNSTINTSSSISTNINTIDYLNKFIYRISTRKMLRKCLVEKIFILKYFPVGFRKEILINLHKDTGLDWRYRRRLLEQHYEYRTILGDMTEYIEKYRMDKVFYIRELVRRISIKIDKEVMNEAEKDNNINNEDDTITFNKEDITFDSTGTYIMFASKEIDTISTSKAGDIINNRKEDNINKEEHTVNDNKETNTINNKKEIDTTSSIQEEHTINNIINKEENTINTNITSANNEFNNNEEHTINNEYPIFDNLILTDNISIIKYPSHNLVQKHTYKNLTLEKDKEIFNIIRGSVRDKVKSLEEKIVFINHNNKQK